MDPSGQEKNSYAYAGCNPINAKDPSGLSEYSCALAIAGAIASAVGLIVSTATIIVSVAAEIPSFGISTFVGVLGVVGLVASTFGAVISVGSIIDSCGE